MNKYGERSYLPVEDMLMATVPVMWGGIYGGVYDRPSQAPAWNRTVDRLDPATGKLDGAVTPGV